MPYRKGKSLHDESTEMTMEKYTFWNSIVIDILKISKDPLLIHSIIIRR